jgi:hypothetical protein
LSWGENLGQGVDSCDVFALKSIGVLLVNSKT